MEETTEKKFWKAARNHLFIRRSDATRKSQTVRACLSSDTKNRGRRNWSPIDPKGTRSFFPSRGLSPYATAELGDLHRQILKDLI